MRENPAIEVVQELVAGHQVELKIIRSTERAYVELWIDNKFFESVTVALEFFKTMNRKKKPVVEFAKLLLENQVFQKEQKKAQKKWLRQLKKWGFDKDE